MAKNNILSTGDVKKLLGISYQYIDQLCREKKLSYEKIGSGKIFRMSDVVKLQQRRMKRAKKDKRIKVK